MTDDSARTRAELSQADHPRDARRAPEDEPGSMRPSGPAHADPNGPTIPSTEETEDATLFGMAGTAPASSFAGDAVGSAAASPEAAVDAPAANAPKQAEAVELLAPDPALVPELPHDALSPEEPARPDTTADLEEAAARYAAQQAEAEAAGAAPAATDGTPRPDTTADLEEAAARYAAQQAAAQAEADDPVTEPEAEAPRPDTTADLEEAAARYAAQQAAAQAEAAAAGEDTTHAVPAFLAAASTGHGAASPHPAAAPDGAERVISPEDTAEIDVAAVESKLSDPGSTQSFAPVTDDLIDTASTYDAGTTMQLRWGARSDVGCVRSHNEDSYLVQSPLFCVCDGMGGHAAGEVASSLAVETIAKTAPHSADPALLGSAIEAANAAIIEAAVNGLGKPGMGCTATAAYIEGGTVAIAHVGDSRAYLLHEGSLIRVTRDHSYVEELVDAGEITADEARVHPNRSVITRALGSDPAMYADHFALNIEEGDRLILCSDGLSSMVSDGEIEVIATQSSTAQICTDNLVDAALAAGGGDNVTVIVVDLVDDGKLRAIARKRKRNAILSLVAVLSVIALGGLITLFSISNSVYLGVKDDAVAIYKGTPHSFMGIELNWLEDETSVMLSDLPEDTRHRLEEGIPQASVEEATETVSKYRKQISDEQLQQAEMANAVRSGADPAAMIGPAPDPADPAAPGAADAGASVSDPAAVDPAAQPTGGDAQ